MSHDDKGQLVKALLDTNPFTSPEAAARTMERAANALLDMPSATAAIPAGWKLVPVELTEAMRSSLSASMHLHGLTPNDWQKKVRVGHAWSDVLAAAPISPERDKQQISPKGDEALLSTEAKPKTYWLIERNSRHKHMRPEEPVVWFRETQRFAQGDKDIWTPHADKAMRFPSEAEAREYLKKFDGDPEIYDPLPDVTEHMDCDGPAPAFPNAVVEPPHGWWSFLRSVLSQGASIQQDYVARTHKGYEEYSARLDAAARERAEEIEAVLSHGVKHDD